MVMTSSFERKMGEPVLTDDNLFYTYFEINYKLNGHF